MSALTNAWRRAGHEVCLITLAGKECDDFYPLLPGIVRERLGVQRESASLASAIVNNVARWWKIRAAFRERSPDVVVAFMTTTNVLALAAAFGLGIPVIVAERVSPEDEVLSPLWRSARQLAYKRAAAVVMLTERSARWLRTNIPAAKAVVIGNPVLVHRGQRPDDVAKAVLASCAESEVLLAAGRLDRQKGFDLLLKAFASVGPIGRNWRLVIIGEGPERRSLESLVAELRLSNRVLLPGVTTTPYALMERAGLFVLSSRYEGLPNALMEAMACGLACISFDCRTGPSEIITTGVDGILVRAEDVPALSRAMEMVMSDGDLRARLGRDAQIIESRHSVAAVLKQWDELFRNVILGRTRDH